MLECEEEDDSEEESPIRLIRRKSYWWWRHIHRRDKRAVDNEIFPRRSIYFVLNPLNQTVKIGESSSPKVRFQGFLGCNPDLQYLGSVLVPGYLRDKTVHKGLKRYHVTREFFKYPELKEYIDGCLRYGCLLPVPPYTGLAFAP